MARPEASAGGRNHSFGAVPHNVAPVVREQHLIRRCRALARVSVNRQRPAVPAHQHPIHRPPNQADARRYANDLLAAHRIGREQQHHKHTVQHPTHGVISAQSNRDTKPTLNEYVEWCCAQTRQGVALP